MADSLTSTASALESPRLNPLEAHSKDLRLPNPA
jgi:hypothetical protein